MRHNLHKYLNAQKIFLIIIITLLLLLLLLPVSYTHLDVYKRQAASAKPLTIDADKCQSSRLHIMNDRHSFKSSSFHFSWSQSSVYPLRDTCSPCNYCLYHSLFSSWNFLYLKYPLLQATVYIQVIEVYVYYFYTHGDIKYKKHKLINIRNYCFNILLNN